MLVVVEEGLLIFLHFSTSGEFLYDWAGVAEFVEADGTLFFV